MDIEQSYISSIIAYPDKLVETINDVPVEAIENEKYRDIYAGVIDLWQDGHTVDIIGLIHHLKHKVQAGDVAEMQDIIPSKANLLHWAGELKRSFQKRRIKQALDKLKDDLVFDDTNTVLGNLTELVAQEMHDDVKNHHVASVVERFSELQEFNREHGIGIDTGFMCFQDKWITYQPNHVVVVGAFTSTGKTSLCIEMLHRAYQASNSIKSVIISTEMNEAQNIARLIARQTGFNTNYLLSGKLKKEHKEIVDDCKSKIASKPIKIYDDVYELSEIKALLRKAKLQGGVDIVFIDYAQNISVKGAKSEYETTDTIAKGIQKLAKECNCTIILFSQLSNSAAKDDEGVLQFKGAGTLSAIADVGIILKKNKEVQGQILMEVRKNRHGALLKQVLQFQDNYTRLKEIYHEANN